MIEEREQKYSAPEVDQLIRELNDHIDKAESEGKWLFCSYQSLWFSPDELRAENRKGQFLWGVVNWQLRDPKEKLDSLREELRKKSQEIVDFGDRITK